MEITNVKIYPIEKEDSKLKAIAIITFDDVFIIRDIRIISGNDGLFIAMPSTKLNNGKYKDICHPICSNFHNTIASTIIEEYGKVMS